VPYEEPICFFTTWIRIPNISVEYFDHEFFRIIGEKISRVIGIDHTTAKVEHGHFTRGPVSLGG